VKTKTTSPVCSIVNIKGRFMLLYVSRRVGFATGISQTRTVKSNIWLVVGAMAAFSVLLRPTAPLAADMPVPESRWYAQTQSLYNWTGLYVGGTLGYKGEDVSGSAVLAAASNAVTWKVNALEGSAIAGFNWQIPVGWYGGSVVVGLEADISGAIGHNSQVSGIGPEFYSAAAQNPWLAATFARVGLPLGADGSWLLYAIGGVGFGEFQQTTNVSGPVVGALDATAVRAAWIGGGGLEFGVNRYWSWRTEYLYVDTGNFSDQPSSLAMGVTFGAARVREDVVRTGIAYHF
jgi:outer membrane immunogenic protein